MSGTELTTVTVTLHLSDMRELFTPPTVSSRSYLPSGHSAAAIEMIADALRAQRGFDAVRTTIMLPEGPVSSDLTEDTRRAIRRYCRARLREGAGHVRELRWRGRRGFLRGGLVLIVLGGAGKWLEAARDLPLQVAGQGLVIAGSIVIEMALWDLVVRAWERRVHARVYEHMMDMEVVVEATGQDRRE